MLDVRKYHEKIERKERNSERTIEVIDYDGNDAEAMNNIFKTALELEYIILRPEKKSYVVVLPREQFMSEWIN